MKINKRKVVVRALWVVFLCYAAVVVVNQQVTINKQSAQQRELAVKVAAQKQVGIKIAKGIEATVGDSFYEQMARQMLGYVKPNEKVYIDATNK